MSLKKDDATAGLNEVTRLVPCSPCDIVPGNTSQAKGDPTLSEVTTSKASQLWSPVSTPIVSPVSSPEKRKRRHNNVAGGSGHKRSRRSLGLKADEISKILQDSGSECDEGDPCQDDFVGEIGAEEEIQPDCVDFISLRQKARDLRNRMVVEDPEDGWALPTELGINVGVDEESSEKMLDVEEESEQRSDGEMDAGTRMKDRGMQEKKFVSGRGGRKGQGALKTAPETANFLWSEDFTSFSGQKEQYTRVPGPTFWSQTPVDIFERIWEPTLMETIVEETNKYAWQRISTYFDPDINTKLPSYLEPWVPVTVEELYRYFAMLIYMTFCYCSSVREYWSCGILGMPGFRELMSRNRFLLISKFLHFSSNEKIVTRGNQRKISKIAPIVDHCNERFKELYTPGQYLSLDESLLLWKGRLSWKQSIRSKAARFGIKSFELCEADTGYLLQYRLYTGKADNMHPDTLHGRQDHTAKVVLDLMQTYLDVGHVLVMDNWYNQLPLTRYLKTRRTDVLGTISRRRNGIPSVIKDLIPNEMERGAMVIRHCGDMALFAWKDVKLVTAISTYHHPEMTTGRRVGQTIQKPSVIHEYNRYMGGVDLKDQKLGMYMIERKRNQKWYMKVFKRLLNTSLLNAYIIYRKNPMYRVYSHRQFRQMVAEGLLSRYPRLQVPAPRRKPDTSLIRLQPGPHFPIHTDRVDRHGTGKHKQLRCVRCSAQKRRVCTTYRCKLCMVPLCIGQCWEDYHTLTNLKGACKIK